MFPEDMQVLLRNKYYSEFQLTLTGATLNHTDFHLYAQHSKKNLTIDYVMSAETYDLLIFKCGHDELVFRNISKEQLIELINLHG